MVVGVIVMNIVWIDMHIRDQRIFDFVRERSGDGGEVQISAEAIAAEFHCHANTARAILKRLIAAEKLVVVDRPFKKGHVYKVVREHERQA